MSVVPPPMSTTMLPRGLGDGQAGPDGGGHGLVHQVDLGGLGLERRVLDRALLDLGHLGGDADDDARPHQGVAVVGLADEVAEHLLGDLEVRDHPVLHGTDGHDVAGGAPQHLLGVLAHRLHLSRDLVDGHDGGLGDHDALALGVDEGVGGAEVDGEVARQEAQVEEGTKVHEGVWSSK